MPTVPFLDRITQAETPILADGAMGTLLHARGVAIDACFDQLNLTRPELVASIHRAYIESGAELVETNTFGANRFKLIEYGLENQVREINRAGVRLAREAVPDKPVYVVGSVGPIGIGLQPYGRLKAEDAQAAFTEQIAALTESDETTAGVDAILFETFSDVAELVLAIQTVKAVAKDTPVIAQITFTPDDRTLFGYLPGRVALDLHAAGADVIGVNCSGGPAQISRVLQAMHQAVPTAILSAMPNAGFPETVGGRTMYPATVEYFADYALTFKALGARIIGGCCGTTPEHIAAMRTALDDKTRIPQRISISEPNGETDSNGDHRPERPSELAFKLANGKFVVSVEMKPPRSYSPERLLVSAELLRDAGADVLNIPDSPTARMRMSPWAVCHLLQSRLGMETILHFPTRGRNLLRIQGDLLGAHALGIRNLFVVMGDPTRIGDYPEAMDNYDIVPSGLIRLVGQKMNMGIDQAGNSIGQPTAFTVGCALNMGAADPDKEIEVLLKKIEAGANFALGQPVFEPHIAERFLARYEEVTGSPLKLPVLMGVMPLYSLKHARFLDNEIPGIDIPPAILKRIEAAGENAAYEGVRIAQELLRDLRGMVQGAYIIPAYGKYELAAQVVDAVVPA
jgi:methionine synthase I (cobalamin-dependent)/5,10-methylenetetrahydrofolate reductase